jgi:hypothetical protein
VPIEVAILEGVLILNTCVKETFLRGASSISHWAEIESYGVIVLGTVRLAVIHNSLREESFYTDQVVEFTFCDDLVKVVFK